MPRFSLTSDNDSESRKKSNSSLGDDQRVTATKRKASINQESPRKAQRIASDPLELVVEAAAAKGTTKNAGTEEAIPKEKQRCSNNACISEPTGVPVEDVTVNRSKRKATTRILKPRKKHGVGNTNTRQSVEIVTVSGRKKEDSVKHLPESQTPRMVRKNAYDLSLISSGQSTSQQHNESPSLSVNSSRADFEAKYLQLNKLGEGGFGSVYAGVRKVDNFPVAIKHISEEDVAYQLVVLNGKLYMIPIEVLLMKKVAGGPQSIGKSAAVSLLDWYDLDQEVLLVMERPVPSVDLLNYIDNNNGPLEEEVAKTIMKQLVEAAIKMHTKRVFHSDIKSENILIETSSNVLRVRVIDFGCGSVWKKKPYHSFSGTSAYVPPEFYTCGMYEAGPATVWQLGALLYEMLDGYKQFSTINFLRKKIKFNSQLPQDCKDLLKRCLTVNPKDRATLEQMQMHPWFTKSLIANPAHTTHYFSS